MTKTRSRGSQQGLFVSVGNLLNYILTKKRDSDILPDPHAQNFKASCDALLLLTQIAVYFPDAVDSSSLFLC